MKSGECRKKIMQNVRSGVCNIDMLKEGNSIRIRGPPFSKVDYYECQVKYIGLVDDRSAGQYIFLQLKNDQAALSELELFLHYYKFKGTEFIVTSQWIMENLYKEESLLSEAQGHANFANGSVPTNEINFKTNDKVVTSTISRSSESSDRPQQNFITEIELLSNTDGTVKNTQEIKCDSCDRLVEINQGVILRECLHSFCSGCICNHVARGTNNKGIQCPYNKEYKCEMDLLDIEIKDLGGDLAYNIILENRLKDFISTVPNARKCPNEKCNNLWITNRMSYMCYERCPSCSTNWCYICNAAHEVGAQHLNRPKKLMTAVPNKMVVETGVDEQDTASHEIRFAISQTNPSTETIIKNTEAISSKTDPRSSTLIENIKKICETDDALKTQNSSIPSSTSSTSKLVESTKCQLCSKIIEISHDGVRIYRCLHIFCMLCIREHIERNLNNPNIPCPYNKYYECRFDLLDTEIEAFAGTEIYDKILSKRLKDFGGHRRLTICPNSDCRFSWIAPYPRIIFERCPKCHANWCYLCEVGHEPSEIHSSKSEKTISTQLSEGPALTITEQAAVSSDEIMNTYVTTRRSSEIFSNKTFRNSSNYFGQEALAPVSIPTKINKTGTIPKVVRHPYNNPSDTENAVTTTTYTKPLSYIAEIEKLDNSRGLVRNPERTKCELCSKTLEIGHGVILRECLHTFCMLCIKAATKSIKNEYGIRCPYNKDYECQFDLLDVELKHLAGPEIYGKILNNRLEEFLATDMNEKEESQKARGRGLEKFLATDMNEKEESQKARGRGEGHKFNFGTSKGSALVERLNERSFGTKPADSITCAKCHKSNILAKKSVTLQNCGHLFCKECVTSMIYTQTSGSKYAQCTICSDHLEDDEVSKIAGIEVLKLFLENRNMQGDTVPSTVLCCCQPQTSNCGVILRCKHRICKTILTKILKEQLQRLSRAVCPMCLEDLDDNQIKGLIEEKKLIEGEKCRMCSNQSDVHLTLCGHWFCSTCFNKFIVKQVSEPNKISLNCIACHIAVTNSDILQYASVEILKSFNSKIEAVKLGPKQIEQIEMQKIVEKTSDGPLNNKILVVCITCEEKFEQNLMQTCSSCTSSICVTCIQSNRCPFCLSLYESQEHDANHQSTNSANSQKILFECNVCKQTIEQSAQIDLINCKHQICRDCFHSKIADQMLWTRTPKCPICMKLIAQNQLDEIGISASPRYENSCSVCFGEFRQKFKLNNCGHVFCRECIKTSIMIQQSNGTEPRCPMCRNSIEMAQIKMLKAERPQRSNSPARLVNRQNRPENAQILKYPACPVCYGIYQKLIELKNCGHAICKQCAKEAALNCPLCFRFMETAENKAHDSDVYGIFRTNR